MDWTEESQNQWLETLLDIPDGGSPGAWTEESQNEWLETLLDIPDGRSPGASASSNVTNTFGLPAASLYDALADCDAEPGT